MEWTKKPPTKNGWYWWQPTYTEPEAVQVFVSPRGSAWMYRPGKEEPQPVLEVGRWAGHISPPN